MSAAEGFTCSTCATTYKNRQGLWAHELGMPQSCTKALGRQQQQSRRKDCTAETSEAPPTKQTASGSSSTGGRTKTRIDCEECGEQLASMDLLRTHLSRRHDFDMKVGSTVFDSWTEFEMWKRQMETEAAVDFVKNGGSKVQKSGKSYNKFYCSRSNLLGKRTASSSAPARGLRRQRVKGSVRSGACCTAFIQTTLEPDGQVSVIYCQSHYGHSKQVEHQRVPQEAKDDIVTWGMQGFSTGEIRLKLKEKYGSDQRPGRLESNMIVYYLDRAGVRAARGHDTRNNRQHMWKEARIRKETRKLQTDNSIMKTGVCEQSVMTADDINVTETYYEDQILEEDITATTFVDMDAATFQQNACAIVNRITTKVLSCDDSNSDAHFRSAILARLDAIDLLLNNVRCTANNSSTSSSYYLLSTPGDLVVKRPRIGTYSVLSDEGVVSNPTTVFVEEKPVSRLHKVVI